MFHESEFSWGHLAISFVVGALAGVAVTMLTSPVSGAEARAQMGRLVRRGRDQYAVAHHAIREGIELGRKKARQKVT